MRTLSSSTEAAETLTPASGRHHVSDLQLDSVAEASEENRGQAGQMWETALQQVNGVNVGEPAEERGGSSAQVRHALLAHHGPATLQAAVRRSGKGNQSQRIECDHRDELAAAFWHPQPICSEMLNRASEVVAQTWESVILSLSTAFHKFGNVFYWPPHLALRATLSRGRGLSGSHK
jgi:hypothetical protein